MSEIRINASIDVAAPAEVVWSLLSDYPRDSEWRTGVLSMTAEPPGPVDVGTVTVEELRLGGQTYRNVGEVIAVDPGRALTWRTTDGADADGRRTVEPLPFGGCRVTLELRVRPTNAIEHLLRPVFARMLRRNLGHDLHRLAALAADTPTWVRA